METPKLKKILSKEVNIVLETGLHIGGIKESFHIGDVDSPVITELVKISNEKYRFLPYIPGSSIKGKIRSLLELSNKNVEIKTGSSEEQKEEKGKKFVKVGDNLIHYSGDSEIIKKVFGFPPEETQSGEINITRLIIRDALPSEETIKVWEENEDIIDGTIIKGENTINRLTSKANPRFIAKVPAGSIFKTEFIMLVFENDDENKMKETVEEGLKLLEMNYLGGLGTRGYGKVKIEGEDWKEMWPENSD